MKKELIQYSSNPVHMALIESGKFDIEQYDKVNGRNWPEEINSLPIRSIEQALSYECPSLALYRKYEPDMCLETLSEMILDMSLFFNINNNLKGKQVELTAEMIQQEYYFLTLTEIKLCFNNAVKGKYGEIYNRLDTQVVLKWLFQFSNDRQVYMDLQERKKKAERNRPPETINKEGLKKLGKMRQGLLDKNKIKERKKDLSRDKKLEGQREANELMNGRKEFTEEEKAAMKKRAEEIDKMLNK